MLNGARKLSDVEKSVLHKYSVTVDYRTHGGSCNTATRIVYAANIDNAMDTLRERVAKWKRVAKIDGGSARHITNNV